MKKYNNLKSYAALGFVGSGDLLSSLFRPNLAVILAPLSALGCYLEYLFGINGLMFTALCVLLTVELITGIMAAKLKKRKLTSRRMQRFGIMVLVWFTLLLITNALALQYDGRLEGNVAHYMHTTILFYVVGIYIKSVLENADCIWKNKINAKELIKKLFNTNNTKD